MIPQEQEIEIQNHQEHNEYHQQNAYALFKELQTEDITDEHKKKILLTVYQGSNLYYFRNNESDTQ